MSCSERRAALVAVANVRAVRALDPLQYPAALDAFGTHECVAAKAQPPGNRSSDVGAQHRPFDTNDGVGQIWQRDPTERRPEQGGRGNQTPHDVDAARAPRANRRSARPRHRQSRRRGRSRAARCRERRSAPRRRRGPFISRSSNSQVKTNFVMPATARSCAEACRRGLATPVSGVRRGTHSRDNRERRARSPSHGAAPHRAVEQRAYASTGARRDGPSQSIDTSAVRAVTSR